MSFYSTCSLESFVMSIKRIFSASFSLKAVFALSLFALIYISGITYQHSRSLAESTDWVMHAYQTNVQLEKMYSYLKDAETGQRGFIITHDSLFLEPYYSALENVQNTFIQLRKLTETKQQEESLDTIYHLINQRFVHLAMSLAITNTIPLDSAMLKTNMQTGKSMMDSIRVQMSKMIALEESYLSERQAKYEQKISITPLFSLLLFLFALSIFIFSYWRINKDLTILKWHNEQLRINSESMAQADWSLKERNRELEQKNKELASFNHVASHDLQEPLRIVQTYISRLTEKETEAMTDNSKEYLVRIKSAVTRMRYLIDDLLLFSRTSKAEGLFEMTDLNILLENAKQDLAQSIEQKKVTITCARLPTLHVIPFQIQQLFTNLMGNSIKYSRSDVPLRIVIESEMLSENELPGLKIGAKKKFYKITVTDNGIGFEQQYAEHIFTLFQRLHHDDEYEGTGIGLAICKKIAENHGGFIAAEGRPGKGSTFFIYLPA